MDFNALNYRNLVGKDKFDVLIPSDGSVTSGYTTTINAYAKRPNIAKMVREHIFSEMADHFRPRICAANPDRLHYLAGRCCGKCASRRAYAKARPVNAALWMDSAKTLGRQWQEQVLSKM